MSISRRRFLATTAVAAATAAVPRFVGAQGLKPITVSHLSLIHI